MNIKYLYVVEATSMFEMNKTRARLKVTKYSEIWKILRKSRGTIIYS